MVPALVLLSVFVYKPVLVGSQAGNRSYFGKFYRFDIVAESGSEGFTGFDVSSSVNDNGEVAFVGRVDAGEGVFVGSGWAAPVNISPGFQSSTRVFNPGVQINNSGLVAARDRISGTPPTYILRIWNSNTTGATTVARGFDSTGTDPFGTVQGYPSLNNNVRGNSASFPRNIVFGALAKSTLTQLTVTPNAIPVTTSASSRNELTGFIQRPMISDNGKVLTRAGTTATSPILVYDNFLSAPISIAGTSTGFSELGMAPGISDDGVAVAFYGSTNVDFPTGQSGANSGPGIFISVLKDDGSRTTVRIAGRKVEDRFDSDWDGFCEAGENCIDSELGTGPSGSAVPKQLKFASYSKDTRVGVVHQSLGNDGLDGDTFIVCFLATPNGTSENATFTDQLGLWTSKITVKASTGPGGTEVIDANSFIVSKPQPVLQVNDSIGSRVVTSLGVNDPISNGTHDVNGARRTLRSGDHFVSFWASTASGQLILRASQFDSDGDALYDHWETNGIDFDNNGTTDLPLQSAPYLADPVRRDIFVEVDRMAGVDVLDSALRAVEMAFHNSPESGIALHLIRGDEVALSGKLGSSLSNCRQGIVSLEEIKKLNLGSSGDSVASRRARDLAFRYLLIGDTQADVFKNGSCVANGSSGFATGIPAQSFSTTLRQATSGVVSLLPRLQDAACELLDTASVCGLRQYQAGTVMHELGHTLGLRHGGGDNLHNKPNYLSTMNYSYQLTDLDATRPLDYSRGVLADLDENGLNENQGLVCPSTICSGPRNIFFKGNGRLLRARTSDPRIDWNDNSVFESTLVGSDINDFGGDEPGRTVLRGFDDWSHLIFDFRNSPAYNQQFQTYSSRPDFGGDLARFAVDEPTEFSIEQAAERSLLVDLDADGIANGLDNCPAAANVSQTDSNGNGIGDVCEPTAPTNSYLLSGRVTTSDNYGINKVWVTVTDQSGFTRRAITNAFGYYAFTGIAAGTGYTVRVAGKRRTFLTSSQTVDVASDVVGVDFIAQAP